MLLDTYDAQIKPLVDNLRCECDRLGFPVLVVAATKDGTRIHASELPEDHPGSLTIALLLGIATGDIRISSAERVAVIDASYEKFADDATERGL